MSRSTNKQGGLSTRDSPMVMAGWRFMARIREIFYGPPLLMPAWPGITGYTKGIRGESDRDKVAQQIAALRAWQVSVSSTLERARKIAPLSPAGICFFSYDGVKDNSRFFDAVRRLFQR